MNKFITGELGLAKTYWIFGVLGSFIIKMFVMLMSMKSVGLSVMVFVAIIYSIIIWIAIWNSADKYKGFQLWPILAKTFVVLGVLSTLAAFNN